MQKSSVKNERKFCIFQQDGVSLRCRNDKTFIEKCPHQSRSGYSSNFYEMPSKAAHAMAGLDRKVPNKPEDYKACDARKSCI